MRFPLSGLAIAMLVSAFVWFGIRFVLYLIDVWQVSTIGTIILYGILFILAKAGAQLRGRKKGGEGKGRRGDDSFQKVRHGSVGTLTAVWYFVGIYAVMWLTPSLIIFWIYAPPYPIQMIAVFTLGFSIISAGIYYFTNEDRFAGWQHKAGYIAGVVGGLYFWRLLFY